MEQSQEIQVGDQIIVQRQGYTKLHKLKKHGNMVIGKFTVQMDNIIGQKYFDTFQMKNYSQNNKLYILEKVEDGKNVGNAVNIETSGMDNRNIVSDESAQTLTKDDIDELQNSELNSNAIVEKLINNSKTFNMKTEYSQEKYIKKKEKKYFEYLQIRKPTIRLLTNMFYRQDPTKTLGIRIDDLSQILTYANIHSDGNHLLYDSGSSGLMSAAVMNAIGANTSGTLIHMHPGNECQKNAFLAMQFPEEQTHRCINVNLYSVLRCFYQNKNSFVDNICNDTEDKSEGEPEPKKAKLDGEPTQLTPKEPQWKLDNESACKILNNKCDSLIVTAKEHPVNIVKELLQFLQGGRQMVVFSVTKEPLQDLFIYLKGRLDIIAIKLSNNFLRNYQVLPERTHPEMMMNTGGFILSAVKLNS
ncbi:tRNA (adenine(58)-N(1))-methyltransferase non-catalytic subunit TRM6 [Sitophilus oryzae]|uniref:tRNA (adenine(58)-N(1))-methyltransferase non-catalytic subunit TRM6 n=1 Tax=Sitophilus oryzae TaxID=7048 RepID=A0A6J2X8C1_SITOR|nr:tRNA (adenine(58)-N(1))-methyltransferase non-catalytic subunit TRM6 [Sitophilus oryzae]